MRRLDAHTEQFLLGRPLRAGLPEAVRQTFTGRRLLITGAGGTVGFELARQLAVCRPSQLVLFDHAEYLLFKTAHGLRGLHPEISLVPVLGDVSRFEDVDPLCTTWRPEFVFHAAACKHVTMAEQNIVTATRTNVLGAIHTARAAQRVGARFVLISTDKAAEPSSVMGATKRLAELCVLDPRLTSSAIAVRFGNVLGSSGSVVEILMDAARAGRPLTVTDPGATRFFMTAAEAVVLVLKAAASNRSGEVFWLDMGSPLRLSDLVERIIDVVVPQGEQRPPIKVIGLRSGEKRNEELTTRDLAMQPTEDPAVWRARQVRRRSLLTVALGELSHACGRGDASAVLRALERLVPDYRPSDDARAAAQKIAAVGATLSA